MPKSMFLNTMKTPTHPRQLKSAWSTCTDGRAFEGCTAFSRIFFTSHYCCISVAEVVLAEKRRDSVTTAVIILLQQDIDLHELSCHSETEKLQDASGRQHNVKSLCRGISSLTQTMHLSCVFRQRLYLWMPNDSRGIIYLIGEMNHSYLASEPLSADWC